jgi:hypothetical protein
MPATIAAKNNDPLLLMNPEKPLITPSESNIPPQSSEDVLPPDQFSPLLSDRPPLKTSTYPHQHLMQTERPTMTTEPEDEYDIDYERNMELHYQDLASDSEDFARSNDEGWYYSDED